MSSEICSGVPLEDRSNASDYRSRSMPISNDLLECGLRFIEIGHRAIKPTQARVGVRDHPGQRLLDLMSNRGRHGVSRHQPRLALSALRKDCANQLPIKHRDLVQQYEQDETAGQEFEHSPGIPADAEASRYGKRDKTDLDDVRAHDHRQP